jgi:ABC-2 type transport system permease protein
MLWLKGWLETRFRLLYMLAFTAVPLYGMHSAGAHASARSVSGLAVGLASHVIPFFIVLICAFLAGAGIATQTPFQASKGLHGSTLFTLSMPVSRLRLMVVRAGIGWLETAAVIGILCCEMWLAMPLQRAGVTPIEMFEQAATLIACSSTVYFLAVLLGTVLDDQWRVLGTMLGSAGIWLLCTQFPLPAFANIVHGMGERSPIFAHTIPWNAMAFSLGLSAILFFAALKIAQRREY